MYLPTEMFGSFTEMLETCRRFFFDDTVAYLPAKPFLEIFFEVGISRAVVKAAVFRNRVEYLQSTN